MLNVIYVMCTKNLKRVRIFINNHCSNYGGCAGVQSFYIIFFYALLLFYHTGTRGTVEYNIDTTFFLKLILKLNLSRFHEKKKNVIILCIIYIYFICFYSNFGTVNYLPHLSEDTVRRRRPPRDYS